MKILVENFCCCLKLEFSAYLLATLGLLLGTVIHITVIGFLIFALVFFENAREIMSEHGLVFDSIVFRTILDYLLLSRTGKIKLII